MLLTMSASLQNLGKQAEKHRLGCSADLHLDLQTSSYGHPGTGHKGTGHSASLVWKCLKEHYINWETSPHLPNGHPLVDYKHT